MRGGDDMLCTEIGPGKGDAVLRFSPVLEQQGYDFGEWRRPEGERTGVNRRCWTGLGEQPVLDQVRMYVLSRKGWRR